MTRHVAFGVLAMAAIVVASNILVQFLLGNWLTYGAFVYPLAFLVTDLMNRVYGARVARQIVLAGFAAGVLCSIVGSFVHGEFGPIVTLRIAIGSGTAFIVAQMLDVFIFDRLRSGAWWKAPLVSSSIGSTTDTFLFFGIAFSTELAFLEPANDVMWANEPMLLLGVGPALPYWTSLATADLLVKVSVALLALIPFRAISTAMLVGRRSGLQRP